MRLFELVKYGQGMLEESGVPDAEIDAALLWEHASGMNRTDMFFERDGDISTELETGYLELIRRRCTREPLQYITGVQNFMGYDFCTSENVLIPRQDTEILVETALNLTKSSQKTLDVLDMCCGTGCIGISYGLLRPDSKVTLADISGDAIRVTRKNITKLCDEPERFDVINTDLFGDVDGQFDLILSNPPYIKSDVIEALMPEVRDNEPRLALDGKADGLYFYRIIVSQAIKYIKDEGYVVFEIGNDQAEDVQHLFVDTGYDDVHVVQDLCRNDRVVYGRYHRK